MPEKSNNQTPEQFAENFIKNEAGPVVFSMYARLCESEGVEKIPYENLMLMFTRAMGAIS